MRHVQIAAEHDRLFSFQRFEIGKECILPAHAVFQPLEPILGIGRIAGYQIELRHFQRQHTTLVIKLIHANAIAHAQRLLPGKDGHTGIALFLRAVPILLIARQVQFNLPRLQLGLVQAESIRVQLCEGVHKALALCRAQAVYIPADQFHCRTVLCSAW